MSIGRKRSLRDRRPSGVFIHDDRAQAMPESFIHHGSRTQAMPASFIHHRQVHH